MPEVLNANRVKQARLATWWAKHVNIVVRVNTVQVKIPMAPLLIRPNALVAPRVGPPKQAAPSVNRVKRARLATWWVKHVNLAHWGLLEKASTPMLPIANNANWVKQPRQQVRRHATGVI